MRDHPAIPQRIAQYRVLERLGRGGMGVVHKGHDMRLGRTVALKFLSADTPGHQDSVRQLLTEARAAAALNHPHIATLFEWIESKDGICFAMEFVPGETMQKRARRGEYDDRDRFQWSTSICDALAEAHDKGIIHRDVKSANVMVTPRRYIKMLDFGLARIDRRLIDAASENAENRFTETGILIGTVDYTAPEILHGEEATPASDVFALGVLLYELLTGIMPFRGRTPAAVLSAIIGGYLPAFPEDATPFAASLEPIVMKALHADRSVRYANAGQVLADLKRVPLPPLTA